MIEIAIVMGVGAAMGFGVWLLPVAALGVMWWRSSKRAEALGEIIEELQAYGDHWKQRAEAAVGEIEDDDDGDERGG